MHTSKRTNVLRRPAHTTTLYHDHISQWLPQMRPLFTPDSLPPNKQCLKLEGFTHHLKITEKEASGKVYPLSLLPRLPAQLLTIPYLVEVHAESAFCNWTIGLLSNTCRFEKRAMCRNRPGLSETHTLCQKENKQTTPAGPSCKVSQGRQRLNAKPTSAGHPKHHPPQPRSCNGRGGGEAHTRNQRAEDTQHHTTTTWRQNSLDVQLLNPTFPLSEGPASRKP